MKDNNLVSNFKKLLELQDKYILAIADNDHPLHFLTLPALMIGYVKLKVEINDILSSINRRNK